MAAQIEYTAQKAAFFRILGHPERKEAAFLLLKLGMAQGKEVDGREDRGR